MAIIDPDGLFSGDRLRRCSNIAQLHWPRLFLASDGFGRLELNYARIVGRAYQTFRPIPSEPDINAVLLEFEENYLLFGYEIDGRLWGQWDTRLEFLPRYKTAADHRSPKPPEALFSEWLRRYRDEFKRFPKCCGKISETFHAGAYRVGVGVGVALSREEVGKPKTFAAKTAAEVCDEPPNPSMVPEVALELQPTPNGAEPKDGKSMKRAELLRIVDPFAVAIHTRHVSRKCSLREAKDLLIEIVQTHVKRDALELLKLVDANHLANCQSWDWTKYDGEFCPGLDKWLRPAKERYLVDVETVRQNRNNHEPLVGHNSPSKNDRAVEILRRNLGIEGKL